MPIFNEDTLTLTFAGCGVVSDYPYNIFIFNDHYLSYDDIHDVLPRTGSNPVDIYRFRSHTEKTILLLMCYALHDSLNFFYCPKFCVHFIILID